jgi:hypothetical protein
LKMMSVHHPVQILHAGVFFFGVTLLRNFFDSVVVFIREHSLHFKSFWRN